MKRIIMFAAAMLLAVSIFAQSQGMGMGTSVSVSVGRQSTLGTGLGLHNVWTVTARHCQDYATRERHLLFGHRWVIDEDACNADPSTVYSKFEGHNLVTNAGFDMASKCLSDTAAQPAACNYFAFAIDSSNTGAGTVAIADTAINSSGTGSTEITTNGLARAQATFAHTNGLLTYTLSKAFSVTGTSTGVNKIGVFNAGSTGTMCYELLFTPVTVNNLDTLTPTLTVTMSNP